MRRREFSPAQASSSQIQRPADHSSSAQPGLFDGGEALGVECQVEFLICRSQGRIHFLHEWYELVEVL
jgi:hypothetical protein